MIKKRMPVFAFFSKLQKNVWHLSIKYAPRQVYKSCSVRKNSTTLISKEKLRWTIYDHH